MNDRSYTYEEAAAWGHAMRLLTDKLSLTRGYSVTDIPRDDFRAIEEAFQEWAVANVRERMAAAA